MAGLQSLPFLQMAAKHGLCSATEGKGELLCTWHACAMVPALGLLPAAVGGWACWGLAAGWAWQEDTTGVSIASAWAAKLAPNGSASVCAWPGASSDVLSSSPLQVSLRTWAAAIAPLCPGIDYFTLASSINDALGFKCCCFSLLFLSLSFFPYFPYFYNAWSQGCHYSILAWIKLPSSFISLWVIRAHMQAPSLCMLPLPAFPDYFWPIF